MKLAIPVMAGALTLAACSGGSGVETPEQFRGTWASDCSIPFVSFAADTMHVFPDDATYDLKSISLEGSDLKVSYETPQGPISETYAVADDTLRLASGNYAGQEAVWQKNPMQKCS